MATQTRKPEASKHLDASLIPLKNALLWRAKELESRAATAPDRPELGIGPAEFRALVGVASEFRALAEELHHW